MCITLFLCFCQWLSESISEFGHNFVNKLAKNMQIFEDPKKVNDACVNVSQ